MLKSNAGLVEGYGEGQGIKVNCWNYFLHTCRRLEVGSDCRSIRSGGCGVRLMWSLLAMQLGLLRL